MLKDNYAVSLTVKIKVTFDATKNYTDMENGKPVVINYVINIAMTMKKQEDIAVAK